MKVLVTGGAGFIASHIVDRLIEQGHEVVIVDDLSTGKQANINPQARFYQLDIRDRSGLEEVFAQEKPDVVNHHAAQTDVRKSMDDPSFDAHVNILGSLNVIQLALKHGIRKIIFASTSAVYPEPEYLPADEQHVIRPVSAYGLSKYVIEKEKSVPDTCLMRVCRLQGDRREYAYGAGRSEGFLLPDHWHCHSGR